MVMIVLFLEMLLKTHCLMFRPHDEDGAAEQVGIIINGALSSSRDSRKHSIKSTITPWYKIQWSWFLTCWKERVVLFQMGPTPLSESIEAVRNKLKDTQTYSLGLGLVLTIAHWGTPRLGFPTPPYALLLINRASSHQNEGGFCLDAR